MLVVACWYANNLGIIFSKNQNIVNIALLKVFRTCLSVEKNIYKVYKTIIYRGPKLNTDSFLSSKRVKLGKYQWRNLMFQQNRCFAGWHFLTCQTVQHPRKQLF
jgi:hypothetical protein